MYLIYKQDECNNEMIQQDYFNKWDLLNETNELENISYNSLHEFATNGMNSTEY